MPPKENPKTPEKPVTDEPSTAPTKAMANLTVVINKLSLENDPQVLLYSALVENDGALGFEQRDLGKKNANQPLTFWTSSGEVDISPPQVNLPSSLQALYHSYCLHVYGILSGGSDNSICMLSPVYVRQPAVAATGKFAACRNDEVGIFFYEVKEKGKSLIVRKELPSESDGYDTFGNLPFLESTYLGAAYDGSDAWVAYQGSNNIIVINNSGTNSVANLTQDKTEFHTFTPITLVFIPIEQWGAEGNANARGCLIVYWLNEDEVIQRSWAIIKDDGRAGDFSATKGPGGKAPTATQHSQMSIVFNAKTRKNYIYCYPKNGKSVVQIVEDPWSSF